MIELDPNVVEPLQSPYFRYGGTFWSEEYTIRRMAMDLDAGVISATYDLARSRQDPFHVSVFHVLPWCGLQHMVYAHLEHGLQVNTNGGWLRAFSIDCRRTVMATEGIEVTLRVTKRVYAKAHRDDIGRYHDVRHAFEFSVADGAYVGVLKASINLPAEVWQRPVESLGASLAR